MNWPPVRNPAMPGESGPEDPSIPVLTERLGLPPLEFDTTLPPIETTRQRIEPGWEGLTALPDLPVATGAAPPLPGPGVHPIAALPLPPPPAFAPLPTPAALAPAPVGLPRTPGISSANTYGGFVPVPGSPRAPAPAVVPAATPGAASAVPAATAGVASAAASGGVAAAASGAASAPASAAPEARLSGPTPSTGPGAPPPFALEPAPATAPEPPMVERRASGNGPHWGRIEVELRSSILRQITEQLPREIESIVQGRMQAAIDQLLASLAEEIHLAVTASLGDIVEGAVRAELDRMRNAQRGST